MKEEITVRLNRDEIESFGTIVDYLWDEDEEFVKLIEQGKLNRNHIGNQIQTLKRLYREGLVRLEFEEQ